MSNPYFYDAIDRNMKTQISKIDLRNDIEYFKIITPVDVKVEDELRYQKEIAILINGDKHKFEKAISLEFPNTWFLHVERKSRKAR